MPNILFLWATDRCRGFPGKVNIAQSLLSITNAYVSGFLPDIRKAVCKPPPRRPPTNWRSRIRDASLEHDPVPPVHGTSVAFGL